METQKTCMVTGATGYIGRNLVNLLLKNNYRVIGIVRENSSLTCFHAMEPNLMIRVCKNNGKFFSSIFEEYSIDVIFHLAAQGVNSDLEKILEANITFGTHLLNAISKLPETIFINTGSFFETGDSDQYNPQSLYAATKYCFQQLIAYYSKVNKLKTLTLRLMDVYGPQDPRPKLWPKVIQQFKKTSPLRLSPGEQKLNLVYIDDVCHAYLTAWALLKNNKQADHRVYYVATEEKFTLKEVIKIFEEVKDEKLLIEWGASPYRNMEIMDPYIGEVLPNWKAMINLKSGIKLLMENE